MSSVVAIVAAAFGGAAAGGAFSGGGGMKVAPTSQAKETAAPAEKEQLSEAEKRNKRLAASMLTQDWGTLKLGKEALLGL